MKKSFLIFLSIILILCGCDENRNRQTVETNSYSAPVKSAPQKKVEKKKTYQKTKAEFAGIPLGGSFAAFKDSLVKKGYKYEGDWWFDPAVSHYQIFSRTKKGNCVLYYVGVTLMSETVYEVQARFVYMKDKDVQTKRYELSELVKNFTELYGEPKIDEYEFGDNEEDGYVESYYTFGKHIRVCMESDVWESEGEVVPEEERYVAIFYHSDDRTIDLLIKENEEYEKKRAEQWELEREEKEREIRAYAEKRERERNAYAEEIEREINAYAKEMERISKDMAELHQGSPFTDLFLGPQSARNMLTFYPWKNAQTGTVILFKYDSVYVNGEYFGAAPDISITGETSFSVSVQSPRLGMVTFIYDNGLLYQGGDVYYPSKTG